ncbi:RnfABCDGE type electron transport complex subunit D [Chitinivorax sp. B]|uniref:RnfABCDGE type electron transport complex subunit D n=1 Tax=Chitinivorax sp. B TaxID=2502235 RepID=UPI002016CE49|nr:RnfABCDGE type electron transport complex subunit D [Chitinivorax sp. B]
MFKVLLALVPGITAYVLAFGPAILLQLVWASVLALGMEAAMLVLCHRPVVPFLTDGSALLTAWLLALSLPPTAPWWLMAVGIFFAIVVAKHLYGGLGNNLFNPAMVGFAVCIVSFPAQISHWLAPISLQTQPIAFTDLASQIFHSTPWDAMTSATPLNSLKTQLHTGTPIHTIRPQPVFQQAGLLWITLGYLIGGLWLLQQRVISWHVPIATLGTFTLLAAALWLVDGSHFASPWFHLQYGAIVLGAFFVATDPVSGPTTLLGKLIFASLIGLLAYVIRVFGGYPDGVAFAVLLMNSCAPLIDHYTQPAVFGHKGKASS